MKIRIFLFLAVISAIISGALMVYYDEPYAEKVMAEEHGGLK